MKVSLWKITKKYRFVGIKDFKLEKKIKAIANSKQPLGYNMQEGLGEKSEIMVGGYTFGEDDDMFHFKIYGIQICQIPIKRYFWEVFRWNRMPVLVNQVFIDDIPVLDVDGRFHKENFKRIKGD